MILEVKKEDEDIVRAYSELTRAIEKKFSKDVASLRQLTKTNIKNIKDLELHIRNIPVQYNGKQELVSKRAVINAVLKCINKTKKI